MSNHRKIKELRTRMINDGFDARSIATAIMGSFGHRPRAAWRLALGLSQADAAEHYNHHFGEANRAPMSANRLSTYERWPRNGERPTPSTICRLAELYEARPVDLIDDDDLQHTPDADRQLLQTLIRGESTDAAATPPRSASPSTPGITYLRGQDDSDDTDDRDPEEVVMAAAHEGSEHAEHAEAREIGDTTLEQLRADVVQLSHDLMTAELFPTFREMRRVRRRIYAALDRQLWPRDQTELYFLLGALNGLMGQAAADLGNWRAGEELIRAGWAYAAVIDHRGLMAYLRMRLATNSYWQGRTRLSRGIAASGLRYLGDGQFAANLHLKLGRAAARVGDAEAALQAITAAHDARARDHHDELLEVGGEFGLSRATQHYLAGEILSQIPDAKREAIAELEQAVNMYDAGPEPGEHHGQDGVWGSHLVLAAARLRDSQLDGAVTALEPVLALTPERRTAKIVRRCDLVRAELAAPRYQGSQQATDLDENIETFCQDTIAADLGELPASP